MQVYAKTTVHPKDNVNYFVEQPSFGKNGSRRILFGGILTEEFTKCD